MRLTFEERRGYHIKYTYENLKEGIMIMNQKQSFFKTVCNIAIPVALQSMLQSSFGIIDQIMIGQLGSVSVAGVGLAGKFTSIYSVMVSAIGAVAGIMIAQYLGQKNKQEVKRSFCMNLGFALILAIMFSVICYMYPARIMGFYSKDEGTVLAAGSYLRIVTGTFLSMAGATILATLFRCIEKARFPLYASIMAAILNTGLNYLLIFGKWGFPSLGANGAAIATVISQFANFFVMLILFLRQEECQVYVKKSEVCLGKFDWRQYAGMLLPILVCELLWSLGENVYAIIYGHLGTDACAAMTLTNPIQGLMIGALCGLSQAAGVIIGKKLGNKEYEASYVAAKRLLWYGFAGAVLISVVIVAVRPFYVEIYQVEDSVKEITKQILLAYAVVAPFKVLNMILGGGIIRSGGKTSYVMIIDTIGTWGFGVPLGFISAFVLHLQIPYVYFILSLEECVRFAISLVVLRKRKWMKSLEG